MYNLYQIIHHISNQFSIISIKNNKKTNLQPQKIHLPGLIQLAVLFWQLHESPVHPGLQSH